MCDVRTLGCEVGRDRTHLMGTHPGREEEKMGVIG
jgi:hypothetical protein